MRRGVLEGTDVWWRRLHQVGHAALSREDIQLSKWAERLIHRWRGHMALFSEDQWLALDSWIAWISWSDCGPETFHMFSISPVNTGNGAS